MIWWHVSSKYLSTCCSVGGAAEVIPQARIVPIKAPDDMAANARHLQEEGYRALKLKFSGDADVDVARVAAVRQAVGNDVMLMIDTNMAYTAKAFIRTFSRIDRYDIALVEQPVAASDTAGLKLITTTLPVPIEADESAGSVADVYDLVTQRAVDVINLKITKLGGLRNVMAAVNICEAGGVSCRLGAAFGPSLLQSFSAHVAGMLSRAALPLRTDGAPSSARRSIYGLSLRERHSDHPDRRGMRHAARRVPDGCERGGVSMIATRLLVKCGLLTTEDHSLKPFSFPKVS